MRALAVDKQAQHDECAVPGFDSRPCSTRGCDRMGSKRSCCSEEGAEELVGREGSAKRSSESAFRKQGVSGLLPACVKAEVGTLTCVGGSWIVVASVRGWPLPFAKALAIEKIRWIGPARDMHDSDLSTCTLQASLATSPDPCGD